MSNLKKVKEVLRSEKDYLKEKFGVKSVGIFGSLVRGEAKKGSDIDLLVDFSETPSMFKFLELEGYLEKKLLTKVDLVTRNALKKEIGKSILQETLYA